MLEEETRPVVTGKGGVYVCTTMVVEESGWRTSVVWESKLDVTCEVSEVIEVERLLELLEGDGAAL